jgi:hypothetical protein
LSTTASRRHAPRRALPATMPRLTTQGSKRTIMLINAYRSTTTSPWMSNFDHLLPAPRAWFTRYKRQTPPVKAVPTTQRIKFWNIVPGDQVVIKGRPATEVHDVMSINRLSNRVFLRETANVCASLSRLRRLSLMVFALPSSEVPRPRRTGSREARGKAGDQQPSRPSRGRPLASPTRTAVCIWAN